ncbi:hypothetical protein J7E62_31980 [Variovorax paradoxus]|nr:hypothetical protein [Variovorax paradoxus]
MTASQRFDAPFVGASLLSAVGSLPLHLLPILITATVVEGTIPASEAGWIAAALVLGNLTVAIGLPSLGFKSLSPIQNMATVIVFAAGMALTSFGSILTLLVGWFLSGMACGAMLFFGATVTAANSKIRWAFTIRLACVLSLASMVALLMLAMQKTSGLSSYSGLLAVVLVFTTVLCGLALVLSARTTDLVPPGVARAAATTGAHTSIRAEFGRSGMTITLLLFAGQTGFWIYSGVIADMKGFSLTTFIWAVTIAKALAAIYLFAKTRASSESAAGRALLLSAAGCIAGILLMYSIDRVAAYVAGLILWQITFNALSARLQGELIALNPATGGRWLTAVVMTGTALGPILVT